MKISGAFQMLGFRARFLQCKIIHQISAHHQSKNRHCADDGIADKKCQNDSDQISPPLIFPFTAGFEKFIVKRRGWIFRNGSEAVVGFHTHNNNVNVPMKSNASVIGGLFRLRGDGKGQVARDGKPGIQFFPRSTSLALFSFVNNHLIDGISLTNVLQYVQAIGQFSEAGVNAIEVTRLCATESDEKL